ncbi:hypothetical protein [Streptomyces sp. HUAS ZL42]|uniref:hypothetical protein n=1 Tax=Streptomyces sp. HUAS ZL42 TaxID=3231715 RepID=UPI00345EBB2C
MTSADRETNHDMTHHDIAFLLADAADEVEIGTAPTQALIRGGRRRKTRRWAVAAGTALVVAGSTGALAMTGVPGGGHAVAPMATQPPVNSSSPQVFQPHGRAMLATGTDGDKEWRVTIDVWPAPVNAADAQAMMNAMAEYGETPTGVTTAAELVGKSAYFVHRGTGQNGIGWEHLTLHALTGKGDTMSGGDIEAVAVPLDPAATDGPERLVIGHVAKTAQEVTCTWKDGTKTVVRRAPADGDINSDEMAIRIPDGSPYGWFVCLAPKGTAYKSVEVTK